MKTAENVKLRN